MKGTSKVSFLGNDEIGDLLSDQSQERIEEAIKLAANNNLDAEAYLRIIARAARMIDDLQDLDHGVVDIGFLAHLLLVTLPANPFFGKHAPSLIPLHDMAINAWQDSNEMENGILYADLVNEIACVVAGLTGGYAYRRRVSKNIRVDLYDLPLERVPMPA